LEIFKKLGLLKVLGKLQKKKDWQKNVKVLHVNKNNEQEILSNIKNYQTTYRIK
jgi:hypothetical protein